MRPANIDIIISRIPESRAGAEIKCIAREFKFDVFHIR